MTETLPGMPRPRRRRPSSVPVATELPVAQVVVDRAQPHLDRVFDYAVPEPMAKVAQPGVRVRVRFGGDDVAGFVVARREASERNLTPLRRVVSPEVVLPPQSLALARAVAARWIGTLPDVLRLAVPPRHARVEAERWEAVPGEWSAPDPRTWQAYSGGPAFLERLAAGGSPRAVWQALPDWADSVAAAVLATCAGGRGAVLVVPSAREVDEIGAALTAMGLPAWRPGGAGWVRLLADDGAEARYRAFLAAARGVAPVVVGTRAAAFAPVPDLGLVVCWDDSDELHAERRAPYPHAREVLAMRAEQEEAALLVGGMIRSVVSQRWLETGWARPLVAPRAVVRERVPRVRALTAVELAAEGPAATARLPGAAWRQARQSLETGPVLVQVPRAGYLPSVACESCRTQAHCTRCGGLLAIPGRDSRPECRWCGHVGDWRCPECGSRTLRSIRVGARRTAEELGRAFPGVRVRISGAEVGILDRVGPEPALVVATPGAEPRAAGGYAAGLLLDAAVVTSRPGLEAGTAALRTWMRAAALVRPAPAGGVVLLVGDPAPAPAQALVRWDPAHLAERELSERRELSLPPAVHLVAVAGESEPVAALLRQAAVGDLAEVLGPLPVGETTEDTLLAQTRVRALIRCRWRDAASLRERLAAAIASLSARRSPPIRVQAEPLEVL